MDVAAVASKMPATMVERLITTPTPGLRLPLVAGAELRTRLKRRRRLAVELLAAVANADHRLLARLLTLPRLEKRAKVPERADVAVVEAAEEAEVVAKVAIAHATTTVLKTRIAGSTSSITWNARNTRRSPSLRRPSSQICQPKKTF